jgi:RecG-like helicase
VNQDLLWRRIAANEQAVAEREKLVKPGENYRLTPGQNQALDVLATCYGGGARSALLHAPTGAGKTAVEFRLAVAEFLRRQAPVIVLVPTRDLLRQHVAYFKNRLAGTPLAVGELHGGVAPRDRETVVARLEQRVLPILIGSGLILKEERYRRIVRDAGFLIVDDVHALDPMEHLKPLRGIHTPALFATATPDAVKDFLTFKEAYGCTASLEGTPFETPPTAVTKLRARFGDDPIKQVLLAEDAIRRHIESDGRIFLISRTRADVPKLTHFAQKRFDVPVTMLHGEMVDTKEQAQRLRKFKEYKPEKTRVAMLDKFRDTLPAILVGTNLVGAGLDIPEADLIVVTDADGFGEADLEQLIGRVGRRERPSEAYLVHGTMQKKSSRRR